jgi:tripartite-type tricarboxylate transporter receptor subunit TctC
MHTFPFVKVLSTLVLAFFGMAASAQDYPNKVVRIVTSEAGGSGDSIARLVAQGLTKGLGQQVIVDSRGILGADVIAKAPPDGYSLLFYGSNAWISPLVRKTSWDPEKDFAPIMLVVDAVSVLVVHPSVPAKSVQELIALAKAKPGELNFASSATGSATHLAGELFKSMTGINIVHIPYKGISVAYNDLIAGRVQMIFGTSGSVSSNVKAGKMRAIAIANGKPSALLPGLPTIASTVPGFEAGIPYAMFAPAKTPTTIINRLNEETGRALKQADISDRLLKLEVEVIASTPAQLAEKVRTDRVQLGKIIRDAGIHED